MLTISKSVKKKNLDPATYASKLMGKACIHEITHVDESCAMLSVHYSRCNLRSQMQG